MNFFIHENASENIVCEMVSIVSRGDESIAQKNAQFLMCKAYNLIIIFPLDHAISVAVWKKLSAYIQ